MVFKADGKIRIKWLLGADDSSKTMVSTYQLKHIEITCPVLTPPPPPEYNFVSGLIKRRPHLSLETFLEEIENELSVVGISPYLSTDISVDQQYVIAIAEVEKL